SRALCAIAPYAHRPAKLSCVRQTLQYLIRASGEKQSPARGMPSTGLSHFMAGGTLGLPRGRQSVPKLLAVLAFLLAAAAAAQTYPSRPVRLIVPAAPGGGTDITARSIVPAIADNLGQ